MSMAHSQQMICMRIKRQYATQSTMNDACDTAHRFTEEDGIELLLKMTCSHGRLLKAIPEELEDVSLYKPEPQESWKLLSTLSNSPIHARAIRCRPLNAALNAPQESSKIQAHYHASKITPRSPFLDGPLPLDFRCRFPFHRSAAWPPYLDRPLRCLVRPR